MSAAERLRALHEAMSAGPWRIDSDAFNSYIVHSEATERDVMVIGDEASVEDASGMIALRNALPELIEVADQAERWGHLEEFDLGRLEHVPTPLGAALAALEAALAEPAEIRGEAHDRREASGSQ